LTLDPARTRVRFTLGATLHSVRGSADLVRGEIRFRDEPGVGPASGAVVIDARSARTGIDRRDRKMHEEVLESGRFPEIVFEPARIEVRKLDPPHAEVALAGELWIHGVAHSFSIPAELTADARDRVRAHAHFPIPYVAWGMKDVSNPILHVEPEVEVEVDAEGILAPPRE